MSADNSQQGSTPTPTPTPTGWGGVWGVGIVAKIVIIIIITGGPLGPLPAAVGFGLVKAGIIKAAVIV